MGGFIRFIKKQYFWLIIPVLLGVMIGTWFMAAGDQIKQFDSRVSSIKGDFSSMGNVKTISPHPNTDFHAGMEKMIKARAKDVELAWTTQYNKQVEVMKWSNQMKPDFIALVDQMRPIERFAGEDEKSPEVQALMNDVLPWMKQSYRDFITTKEMVRLADIISAEWNVDMSPGSAGGGGGGGYGGGYGGGDAAGGYGGGYGGGGGGGGYGGEDFDDDELVPYVVYWSSECQEQIKRNSFGWLSRGSGEPSLIELLYTQEDLWVLDSLMQIIASTNGDARIKEQAAVKQIDAIELGIAASRRMKGNISPVQSADDEEDDGMVLGMGGGGDGGYGGAYGGGDPYGGMGGDDDDDEEGGFTFDPLEERYVDKDYAKLASADVTSRASSDILSDVMVAKRIAVRMKVSMDTRKLAHFLSACANAPLTFEVHQVRINASDAPGGMAAMGGGYGGGYGDGGGGGGYGGGYGGGGGGYGDDMNGIPAETYDKTVEFFGVVNIFNPVDRKKLYSAIQSEDGEMDDAEPAADETDDTPADDEAADENEVAAAN